MPKGKPNAKWLRLTEERNALDYLEIAYDALRHTQRDPLAWKWVVIGLHGALYGFAICVLKGTNWEGVVIPGRHPPRLIAFDEALKRTQDPELVGFFTHSKPIQLSPAQRDSIAFLKKIRNQLEHYRPLGWSIELHGLAVSAHDALAVVGALALETGNVRLGSQRKRVSSCVQKGRMLLESSHLYRDFLAAKRRMLSKTTAADGSRKK